MIEKKLDAILNELIALNNNLSGSNSEQIDEPDELRKGDLVLVADDPDFLRKGGGRIARFVRIIKGDQYPIIVQDGEGRELVFKAALKITEIKCGSYIYD